MAQLDNPIHITHYINPHCFYYKPETAYMQEHEQAKFAAILNEFCETEYGMLYDSARNPQMWKLPKPGDLVAMRSNQLERWIRCEVEEVAVDLNQIVWYYLWAIDEGFPIKSGHKYIRPLPKPFVDESAHAKRGAIINILPGDTRYDYVENEQITELSTKWCPGIVGILELMLEHAASISFVSKTTQVIHGEAINFGELYITTQTNVTHNVAEQLGAGCPNQMIVAQGAKFFREIEKLPALNSKRYLNNEGLDNHFVNNYVSHSVQQSYQPTSLVDSDTEADTKVTLKVHEWLRQTKEARVAILEQQKANVRGQKHEAQAMDAAVPASEFILQKYLADVAQQTDENGRTTVSMDNLSPEQSNEAVDRKPSKLMASVYRHKTNLLLKKHSVRSGREQGQ
ncbi:uncharacterized protein LOC118517531 [Anopheles stephensi]|uniref:uncharacterized protein LOC118517531 n=1 Tax=Anopheles stephensi TaxID=30069 RepID=UPI001658A076|nr:uncharacterized protein LOC118517531 [Anopheles stephensi]